MRHTVVMSTPSGSFTPEPHLPQDPEFYRRVLNQMPSPVLVVDDNAKIVYVNQALVRMGGFDLATNIGRDVLDFIHPDDVSELAESFVEIVQSDVSKRFATTPWASLQTRMIASNGLTVPVVITGTGGLEDQHVGGVIYDVRPAHEQDILRRGLTGLAQGEPIDSILTLIADMIALPPLDLDAAVLERRDDGTYRAIGATNPGLGEILERAVDPNPWNVSSSTPTNLAISEYPGGTGEDMFAAGYREIWHVSPEFAGEDNEYRIVACSPTIHRPTIGPVDRLARANELASVVLLRARADALLERSATHDALTHLPNREGFYREATIAVSEPTAATVAMLFIDLDGFKSVNDEHGHAAGDQVLKVIARRLKSVTRSVDLVARLGGDEFVILLGASQDRPANRDRLTVIADRSLHQLTREISIGDHTVTVSGSIGGSVADTPIDIDALIAKADTAMYLAKREGGSRHHIVED